MSNTMSDTRKFINLTISSLGLSTVDGALRMLCVLYFYQLGLDPIAIAFLFILYEVAGIFTNFLGGWIGNIFGLKLTLVLGMALQVVSLLLLGVDASYLTVSYVMFVQGLAGISKDLVKMSAKSSTKLLNTEGASGSLFHWISILTGFKNTFKGLGFLLGGLLLTFFSFTQAVLGLAFFMFCMAIFAISSIPKGLGKLGAPVKFTALFSKTREINILSMARFFLFGSRDIWFVIALPVYLQASLSWSHSQVSLFIASWVIAYGIAQSLVPKFLSSKSLSTTFGKYTVSVWTGLLTIFPLLIVAAIYFDFYVQTVLIVSLILFGIFFAINSINHSYLILALSSNEKVSTDVGFYYMANSCGRLAGTLLSGFIYQSYGMTMSLMASVAFLGMAAIISCFLEEMKG